MKVVSLGKNVVFIALLLLPLATAYAAVTNLRCENMNNPLGIDMLRPRLSWKLETGNWKSERGIRQTAYQVLVASSEEGLKKDKGDLWDSGKVVSDQSIAVRYAGTTLASESRYWWKVRVYDNNGGPSVWSDAAMFMTGKMRPEDWRGKWIGADLAPRGAGVPTVVLGFAVEANRADKCRCCPGKEVSLHCSCTKHELHLPGLPGFRI